MVPAPSDSQLLYLEGLNKLEAIRRVIDAIVGGEWDGGDPDLTFEIADLAYEAFDRFRRAKLAERRAA